MPELVLDNLKLGQRADGGLKDDAFLGLRRLVNYKLIYGGPTVDLEVRPGYERWNANEFSVPAKQLRIFVDQLNNQHILMNMNDLWYKANVTGAHTMMSSFAATPQRVYAQWGNRAFLGTDGVHADDPGIVWVSDATITGSPHAHRLGIKKPNNTPTVNNVEARGMTPITYGPPNTYYLNTTTFRKLGICFTVATDIEIDCMYIGMNKPIMPIPQPVDGDIMVKIVTDNAGEPSDTLIDDAAVSDPVAMNDITLLLPTTGGDPQKFSFQNSISLTAGTTYWAQVYGDDDYYSNYAATWYVAFWSAGGMLPPIFPYHPMSYDNVTSQWFNLPNDVEFRLGGLNEDWYYDYVMTYYNSTHLSESQHSGYQRLSVSYPDIWNDITLPSPSDAQIDKIRLYRREVAAADTYEDDVIDTYHYVGEGDPGSNFIDAYSTQGLGAEIQSSDHYCLDDIGEEGTGERTEVIVPTCICMWKGRLWIGEETNSVLKYSKVFEEDGATGFIGASSVDYFPLDNRLEIPEPGHPLALYPASNDQLIVHMSNDTAYTIYGGDQSLNPPADFAIVPLLHTNASLGIWCGTLWSHFHFYLSKAGLYRVSGMGMAIPNFESEENQSILDAISTANLALSRIVPLGHEVWSLIDWNDDGILDTVFIADLQRDIPTRQGIEKTYRMYQYDVDLNDIDAVSSGDDLQEIYAADAENGFILKLNKGTLDHETSITSYLDSHDLPGANQAMISQIDIDVFMADLTARPTYSWLLTDHNGDTQSGTLTPTANDDTRGARSGTRLKGATSVRARITQVSTRADRVRGLVITFDSE